MTRISLARLYNTGNYEHIRFEISAEVPKGGSAGQTLLDLGAILARLKPLKVPCHYDTAVAALQKPPEELSEMEKANLDDYRRMVDGVEGRRALRQAALHKLDNLGGASKRTVARDSWDDDEGF